MVSPLEPIVVNVSLQLPLPPIGVVGQIPVGFHVLPPAADAEWTVLYGATRTRRVDANGYRDFLEDLGLVTSDETYRYVEAYFTQRDGRGRRRFPLYAVVARRQTPAAQTYVATVVGTTDGNYTIPVDLFGEITDVTFVAAGNTLEQIRDGLVAQGTADFPGGEIVFTPTGGGPPWEVTLTAGQAGIPFAVGTLVSPAADLTGAAGVPNVGIDGDLTAALAEDPTIYEANHAPDGQLGKFMAQAISASGALMLHLPQSSDAEMYNPASTTDLAAFIDSQNLGRSMAMYHHADNQPASAAWTGLIMPFNPGRVNREANALRGGGDSLAVTPSPLTAGEAQALADKSASFYADIRDGWTRGGRGGNGQFLEAQRLADVLGVTALTNLQALLLQEDIIQYDEAGTQQLAANLRTTLEVFAGPNYLAIRPLTSDSVVAQPVESQDSVDVSNAIYRGLSATVFWIPPISDVEVEIQINITF